LTSPKIGGSRQLLARQEPPFRLIKSAKLKGALFSAHAGRMARLFILLEFGG